MDMFVDPRVLDFNPPENGGRVSHPLTLKQWADKNGHELHKVQLAPLG
jgi:hypothetical protein